MIKIVMDTNVFVSALMSKQGAAYLLLQHIGTGKFEICLSVALVLEYEEVAKRFVGSKISLTSQNIDDILDYLCLVGESYRIYYLWRPTLIDTKDDMVLELAIAADCDFIVTHNVRHFKGAENFAVEIITPKDFLVKIGVLS